MVFVGDDALAHGVKQCLYLLSLLLGRVRIRDDERHALQVGDSDVGNDEKGGNCVSSLVEPGVDVCRLDAGSHHNQQLAAVVEYVLDAFQYLLYEPGLYHYAHDVGTLSCQLVARGGGDAEVRKVFAGVTRGICHTDVLVLDVVAFDETLCQCATHGAGSDDGNFHNVFNILVSLSMNWSASSFVRQSGGSRRRMFWPAQPVKQCS